MRFSHINNITIIAVISFILAILEYKLDLQIRVQQQDSFNIFEMVMVTAVIFTALCSLYILGFLIYRFFTRLKKVKS